MAYFGKTFVVSKEENGAEFMKAVDMPQKFIDVLLKHKTTMMIEKDGDTYTLSVSLPHVEKKIKFTSGVEIEEHLANNINATSVFTVNGDVITQEQKFPKHILSRKLEFSDNQVIETLTTNIWNGSSRRTYVPA